MATTEDNNNHNNGVENTDPLDWKTLSKEECDQQYSPSFYGRLFKGDAAIESFIKIICERSDHARSKVNNHELDVPYGDSEREKLDILKPDEPVEDAPVLVFFHGGVWQALQRDQHVLCAGPITHHGAILVSVGYTLTPEASLATIVDQSERAVAFVANRYPKSRAIYTSGHSAGGHLAAMMLSVDWAKYQLPVDLIKGACPFSGILDVRPFVNTYMNDALKLTVDEAWRLSPLNHIREVFKINPNVQVFNVCGDHDPPAYQQQSRQYHKALESEGITSCCKVLDNADHFEVMQNLWDEKDGGTQMLLNMMSISPS